MSWLIVLKCQICCCCCSFIYEQLLLQYSLTQLEQGCFFIQTLISKQQIFCLMIAEKLRSFKLQIRQRSHCKKIEKIRYFNWLHSGVYNEELQQLLLQIGACRLSEKQPDLTFLSSLFSFIQDNAKNWNVKLLFWQQLYQLDFLNTICCKIEDVEVIYAFSHLILIDLAENYDKIQSDQCKETFEDVYQRVYEKSWSSIILAIIEGAHQLIQKNFCFQTLSTIDKLFSEIKLLMKISEKLKIQVSLSKTFLRLSQCPEKKIFQYIQSISECYQQNCKLIPSYQISQFLSPLLYLNRLFVLTEQNCHSSQPNKKKEHLGDKTMKALACLIQISDPSQIQDYETILKILNVIYLNCPSFIAIVRSVIENVLSPSTKNISPNICINQSYYLQCLVLLHKISYEYEWLCYQHIRKIILAVLYRLQVSYEIEIEGNKNIFESEQFRYQISFRKNKRYDCEITLIKLLNNLVSNQYAHSCSYDYYQALQQIADDLLLVGVLDNWCLNNKIAQYLQHLLILLLNLKNETIKIKVIRSCSTMLRSGISRLKQQLVRKIKLYCRLYDISSEVEGYAFQCQQYLSTNDLSYQNSQQSDYQQVYDL